MPEHPGQPDVAVPQPTRVDEPEHRRRRPNADEPAEDRARQGLQSPVDQRRRPAPAPTSTAYVGRIRPSAAAGCASRRPPARRRPGRAGTQSTQRPVPADAHSPTIAPGRPRPRRRSASRARAAGDVGDRAPGAPRRRVGAARARDRRLASGSAAAVGSVGLGTRAISRGHEQPARHPATTAPTTHGQRGRVHAADPSDRRDAQWRRSASLASPAAPHRRDRDVEPPGHRPHLVDRLLHQQVEPADERPAGRGRAPRQRRRPRVVDDVEDHRDVVDGREHARRSWAVAGIVETSTSAAHGAEVCRAGRPSARARAVCAATAATRLGGPGRVADHQRGAAAAAQLGQRQQRPRSRWRRRRARRAASQRRVGRARRRAAIGAGDVGVEPVPATVASSSSVLAAPGSRPSASRVVEQRHDRRA